MLYNYLIKLFILLLFLSCEAPAETITVEELSIVVEDVVGLDFVREPRDRLYKLIDKETFVAFLDQDDTDKLTYIIDWRDCDDFARIFLARVIEWMPGLPIGIANIDNGTHVVNVFVDSDLQVWFVDAQHDRVYEAYEASFIYM